MMKKALDAVREFNIPIEGRHVIVGLSGGSDSMSLLHILLSLQSELNITVSAAHVNHGIRGEEADRDEAFVRDYCEKHGVPLNVLRVSIPDIVKETGESSEECGRRIRYEFFGGIDKDALIATAHNLNDSAETFFINLARGTGLKGLTGIPSSRGNIIRPLIYCSKDEIFAYCRENNIPFVTDSTNLSDDYTRNKIRNTVIPLMLSINPSFFDCFARTESILKEDEKFLSNEAEKYLSAAKTDGGFSVIKLAEAPMELMNRVVFGALKELTGAVPEAEHVKNTAEMLKTGGSENINGGATVRSDGITLMKVSKAEKKHFEDEIQLDADSASQNGQTELSLAGKEIIFSVERPETDKKIYKEVFQYSVNCDRILYPLTVRTKKDGDKFRPAGRHMTKTLKKLFLEKHLSAEQKAETIIVADKNGIVCAEGFGIDERFIVKNGSHGVLYITIRR